MLFNRYDLTLQNRNFQKLLILIISKLSEIEVNRNGLSNEYFIFLLIRTNDLSNFSKFRNREGRVDDGE